MLVCWSLLVAIKGLSLPLSNVPPQVSSGILPFRIWGEFCEHRGCCLELVLKLVGRCWESRETAKCAMTWNSLGRISGLDCPTSCTDSPRSQHDQYFHLLAIALHRPSRFQKGLLMRMMNVNILYQFFSTKKSLKTSKIISLRFHWGKNSCK